MNYVLFIQDLLDSTPATRGRLSEPNRQDLVLGIDIGTGASCIYPLLAVRSRPGWKFLATELDPTSVQTAIENVVRNGFEDAITVAPAEEDETGKTRIIPNQKHPWFALKGSGVGCSIDFTMCNPPFFDSNAPDEGGAVEGAEKVLPARAVCEATISELQTPGGEVGFVTQMVLESVMLGTTVRWYTTLLGQKSSIQPLVGLLRKKGIRNYAITRLTTGQNWKGTVRWVLAWSLYDVRPPPDMARGGGPTLRPFWPEVGELDIPNVKMSKVREVLDSFVRDIRGTGGEGFSLVPEAATKGEIWGYSDGDVWSRKARRARERGQPLLNTQGGLGWRIVRDGNIGGVKVLWREGQDRVLFESFSGWLKREVTKSEEKKDAEASNDGQMEIES